MNGRPREEEVATYVPSATVGTVLHQLEAESLMEDGMGFFHPTCECGWRFGPVPDRETFIDVLMAHAFQEGAEAAGTDREGVHILELTDSGWSILHPMACRPNLQDCPSHKQVMEKVGELPETLRGRYPVHLDGQTLVVGERIAE